MRRSQDVPGWKMTTPANDTLATRSTPPGQRPISPRPAAPIRSPHIPRREFPPIPDNVDSRSAPSGQGFVDGEHGSPRPAGATGRRPLWPGSGRPAGRPSGFPRRIGERGNGATPRQAVPVNIPHPVRSTGRTMNPVNIAVNTSYPGAVKQVKQGPETRPETVEDRREEIGYP